MFASDSLPPPLRFEPDTALVARERRHSGRVQATGTAIVHGSFAARGRIIDLAVGGLTVLVDDAATVPEVGARVRVDVRLDGRGDWLPLVGSVARVDARGSAVALAIELLVVPPEFEDLIQDELLAALECSRRPRILLVDVARGRRELVAAAFRATGCEVLEVSSPLEAINAIDQSRLHLLAVVIADTEIASRADDLRSFLGEMYPRVPLIVVGQRRRRYGTRSISVDRTPDLAMQIHRMVGIVGTRGQRGGMV
jgi:CheY-like chemotaxis protein